MKKALTLCLILLMSTVLVACSKTKYKVTFVISNEKQDTQTYYEHTNYNDTFKPYLRGYEFLGWFINETFSTPYEIDKHKDSNELTLYAKWGKKNTDELDSIELYQKAYEHLISSEYLYFESTGTVKASIANQNLKSIKKKKGNDYYQYTASKGLSNTYFEMYGNKDSIKQFKGSSLNGDLVPSNGKINPAMNDLGQFKEAYGGNPNELYYIVNPETVISSNLTSNGNGYQVTMTLDLVKSTEEYKKNIRSMNQYDTKNIDFKKIIIVAEIDKDCYFKKISYEEEYVINVKAPIIGWSNQTVSGLITDTFISYDNNFEINPYFK